MDAPGPAAYHGCMSEHLHHKLDVLHQNLLHGKLPRSLRWSDAVELVEHLGQVQSHGGEEFAFIVGAHRELFKKPHGSDLGIEEVSRLRKLFKAAGDATSASGGQTSPADTVVVIDHHGAHVFREPAAGAAQDVTTVKPYDPHHFHHHLIHRKEAHYEGERVPEEASFYKEIVEALVSARDIILIGHGVGKSSAVEVLSSYLKDHRPDISQRVRKIEVADLSALSEPQIEALAKRSMGGAA